MLSFIGLLVSRVQDDAQAWGPGSPERAAHIVSARLATRVDSRVGLSTSGVEAPLNQNYAVPARLNCRSRLDSA